MPRWVCIIITLACSHVVLCQTDKQAPAKRRPAADTVKTDRVFDPFVPRQAAEKLFALENVQTKSIGLSRLASLIWKHDEEYARVLFDKALAVSNPQNNSSDGRLKIIHRNVVSVIATRDAAWAKRLIDSQTALDDKDRNSANIDTAIALIDSSPGEAVEFAQRALSEQLNPAFLYFLMTLRKTDQTRADQTFLQVLRFLGQQSRPDIKSLHLMGVYLFTAPHLIDSGGYAVTVVDRILVPNITVQRPGMSAALVNTYLTTASSLLVRAVTDKNEQQFTYALGRMLLIKARSVAPDLVPQIEAAMAAVSSDVPATLTNESAFKYIDMQPRTPEESLANAERKADELEREIAFLDIAASAWRTSDFKTVRAAASMIKNTKASQTLGVLVEFGEAATLLKRDAANVSAVEKVAYKLPAGLERAMLLLLIAQTGVKNGKVAEAEEAIDASLKAASAMEEFRRPYLSLIAAGQLAQLRSLRAPTVAASTIRDLNSFDAANYASVDWTRDIEIIPLKVTFSLEISGLDLNLDAALRAIFLSDLEIGFARAQELKNEGLRSRALVAFVAAYLEKLEKDSPNKPTPATSK
jgi:hypothetical protein